MPADDASGPEPILRPSGRIDLDVNLSRKQLFTMFGALYFVQGVIQAYQLNFFKPHMDEEGIDPALAGSVILTTVTDVIGFMVFLGLGTLFLL